MLVISDLMVARGSATAPQKRPRTFAECRVKARMTFEISRQVSRSLRRAIPRSLPSGSVRTAVVRSALRSLSKIVAGGEVRPGGRWAALHHLGHPSVRVAVERLLA